MKEKEKIQKLKDNYDSIEVPSDLDDVVNKALKGNKKRIAYKSALASVASIAVIFVASVNMSHSFADTLENIPIIGNLVTVVRLSNYRVVRNGFDISIDVPKVEGLKDKNLENKLNEELESDAKKLYNEYLVELKQLEKDKIPGRDLVQSWYEVLTDTDKIFSMVVYNYHAQGSSNTTRKFYNLDKEKETAITLDSLFNGEDYINIISENIKAQMTEQMKADPNKVYWLNSEMPDMDFDKIKEDQDFYINENNELVICFDKYDVAPGAMGLVEFKIPKDIINPVK